MLVEDPELVICESEKEKFREAYRQALAPKHEFMKVLKRPAREETGEGEKKTLTFISHDDEYDFQIGFENDICYYIHICGNVSFNFLFYSSGKISLDYKGKCYYTSWDLIDDQYATGVWKSLLDLKLHFEKLIKE